MIKVKNLFKNYGRYNVLKGVNIEVREGEVYGFIGENGAGKSTSFGRAVFSSRPTGKKGCCGNNTEVKERRENHIFINTHTK